MKNKKESQNMDSFQAKLGYVFQDENLLKEALTHPSFANASGLPFHNQRLEFLGDAVLELAVSENLFLREQKSDEGALTKRRSQLVRKDSLFLWAKEIGLCDMVLLGKSLKHDGVTESVAADAAEAVFGAIFLDGGYAGAKKVIENFLQYVSKEISPDEVDPKTALQEKMQAEGLGVPHYKTVERKGPPSALRFKVVVTLGNKILASAWGESVKAAEFSAASKALSVSK